MEENGASDFRVYKLKIKKFSVMLVLIDLHPVTFQESNLKLLKTKHRLLYLKIQFVPHSKHFSSRL